MHFGKGVYANSNLTMVDDTRIYAGDHAMFGPNVTPATAGTLICRDCAGRITSIYAHSDR